MSENPILLKLSGIIDSENSESVKRKLMSELERENPESIVLDAEELVFISSAGLRMLLQIRQTYPNISIINVHPDIYEILDTTGFTEMMNIEKAFKTVSVEGCEVIGEGANGKVYRIDRETVVKTYKNADALPEIRHEQNVARLALILGIPTAISYDVVRVGDSYGSVFELLDAQSFSKILTEHPEKMDWCVREYTDLLKRLHSTTPSEGKLPSMNQTARGWVSRMKSCLTEEQGQKLQGMIDALPDPGTLIHGDYHTKNIVLSGDEVLLIDMDTLSTGHPVLELAQMYCSFLGFFEREPERVKDFQGFDAETAREFWKRSLKAYLDTENEQVSAKVEDRIRCVAYARLIDWSMRHRPTVTKEVLAERELWKQELTDLLARTDTLFLDLDEAAGGPETGGLIDGSGTLAAMLLLQNTDIRKTDIHMHTTVSDGTDTPEELLEVVRKAGIPFFSATDHDSTKACGIILDSLREGDPHFITGVEFSCKDEEGNYHILGYGFVPDVYPIKKLTEIGHAYRVQKSRERLNYLIKNFNIRIPDEAVKKLYSMDNPGKPHIGNLMVKYGYAPTKEAAIKNYLNRVHFTQEYLKPEDAVLGILAGGGIPVLAHPVFGSGDQLITGEALEQRLKKLMGYGLKGVEAFYSGFTKEQSREVLSLAEKYGLYVTAGSDYHGRNKNVLPGDNGMDASADLPEGFQRFLADVRYY